MYCGPGLETVRNKVCNPTASVDFEIGRKLDVIRKSLWYKSPGKEFFVNISYDTLINTFICSALVTDTGTSWYFTVDHSEISNIGENYERDISW